MKLRVDKEKCIGCGSCAAMFPDVFEVKGDKAEVKKEHIDEKSAKEAIELCPVQAIKKE